MTATAASIQNLLHRAELSQTESRRRILLLFVQDEAALTHADIESRTPGLDRVTVYRTLQTFEERGIIHSIPSPGTAVKYALCKGCDAGHHRHDHVHFVCRRCDKTICLDEVVSPQLTLPAGYLPERVEVLINGVCGGCSSGVSG